MITEEDKERVRQATDIVALVSETVVLRQRGGDFWGCCPFHHEKSPSFHVTPATGLWHCFGCHSGGDVFDYVMKREGLDFLDSVRFLAERAHIDIDDAPAAGRRGPKRTRVIDALEAAQSAYSVRLMRGRSEAAAAARSYFAGRGFNSDICSRWHLGFADPGVSLMRELTAAGFSRQELEAADLVSSRSGRARDQFYNRVMFPIHDEQGRCIGFGGRVMGDAKPKYLNTRETSVFHKSKHLFAFDYAKESIAAKGYAIVSEGYMDVISMHEAGFTNTVAALGTALSLDHVKTLSRFAKTIVCMFDGDAAGQHAAEAAVRYVESTAAALTCVVLPDNQDPDEFLKAHGAQAMAEQLRAARPLIDFVLEKKLEGSDLSSPGLRLRALDDVAKVLAPLKNSYLLDSYLQRVTGRLGVDLEAARRKVRETPVEQSAERDAGSSRARAPEPDGPSYDDVPYDDYGYEEAPVVASPVPEDPFLRAVRRGPRAAARRAQPPGAARLGSRPVSPLCRQDCDVRAGQTLATRPLPGPYSLRRRELPPPRRSPWPPAPARTPRASWSSSSFSSTSSWDAAKNVEFVVGEAEIRSLDRRISQLTASLGAMGADESREALRELSQLRARRDEVRASQPLE